MENNTKEYSTLGEAFTAAAEAAVANFGRPVSGIMYNQAGRRFVSTSLPVKMLLAMAKRDSVKKEKDDPGAHRNRPLNTGHVKEIMEYILNESKYLLPPIMLNVANPLQVFVYGKSGATRPCVFVLPPDEYLYVTDGQHRLEALRQALAIKPELEQDAVGVTVVEEHDMNKVHQDFYDAAQVMALPKALLVEYDGRAPINWVTQEITSRAHILKGRVERIGSIGKNSLKLFTTNVVKQGVLQLVVGDWSLWNDAMLKQAAEALEPAKNLWRDRLVNFFDDFTEANEQWHEVADRPLESGQTIDVPGMREKYLHFTGAGLLVLSGAGHSILAITVNPDGTLTAQQKELIGKLAALDWSRHSDLWKGYLISQGTVTPHKVNIVLAVAKVKKAIGVALTKKEEAALQKSEQGEPVSIT
jgi:DGQHR domain-containing protein